MNKEIKNLSMPINKIEYSETTNPSLCKCSIYVMHTGENFNGSSFSEESVLYAKETLKNIPILASIRRDEDYNPIDFEGHEMQTRLIENSNGDYDWKVVYIEKPIGVIPETNNYRIETLDNGEKWVVVDGYIWKEYGNGAYELLKANDKKVSMEISVDEGYFDDDFMYHIKKYNYLGVTVLGEDNPPAMGSNAVISLFNEDSSAKEEYSKLLNEIKSLEQGGEKMEDNKELSTEELEINTEDEFAKDEKSEDMAKKKKCESESEDEVEDKKEENYETKYNEVVEELNSLKAKFTDLTSELEALKCDYSTLKEETEELRKYRSNVEFEQHKVEVDEVLAKYSELEAIDGYSELVKEKYTVDIKELEKAIKVFAFDNGVTLTKKNIKKNFSKENAKIPIINKNRDEEISEAEKRYGLGISKYIRK